MHALNVTVTAHQALEKAREQIARREFVNISGVAIALAREQGLGKDTEVRTHFLEKMDKHMDETGPGDDTVKLLRMYRKDGVHMGIVTFMRRPRLLRRLEKWSLKDYFESIITPELIEDFKPSPQPFLKAMEDLDLKGKDCIVVGDEPADIMGGKRAGALAAGLPQGFFSGNELKQAGADYILSSLTLLPTITH